MEIWLSAVTEIGFPAVVTLFLLYRIEAKLDQLDQSIQNLPYSLTEYSAEGYHQDEKERSYK